MIVPVQVNRGEVLKDYVGQSIQEIRDNFRTRKKQSLDQEVLTGNIALYRGKILR